MPSSAKTKRSVLDVALNGHPHSFCIGRLATRGCFERVVAQPRRSSFQRCSEQSLLISTVEHEPTQPGVDFDHFEDASTATEAGFLAVRAPDTPSRSRSRRNRIQAERRERFGIRLVVDSFWETFGPGWA